MELEIALEYVFNSFFFSCHDNDFSLLVISHSTSSTKKYMYYTTRYNLEEKCATYLVSTYTITHCLNFFLFKNARLLPAKQSKERIVEYSRKGWDGSQKAK